MKTHPSAHGVAKKFVKATSADDTELTSAIVVPDNEYGVVWKVWVDLDVASEADLEALPGVLLITVAVGAVVFMQNVHPYVSHVDAQVVVGEHRTVDLGPWFFDFGPDGFYTGIRGDSILLTVAAAGTGIKTRVNYFYSGD